MTECGTDGMRVARFFLSHPPLVDAQLVRLEYIIELSMNMKLFIRNLFECVLGDKQVKYKLRNHFSQ